MLAKVAASEPITSFKRDTAKVLRRLKRSGTPLQLTVNGKVEVVVQDAEAYRKLAALAALAATAVQAEMIAFLRASLADVRAGRTVDAEEFLDSLGESP